MLSRFPLAGSCFVLALTLAACGQAPQPAAEDIAAARDAAKTLASRLQTELKAALQSGGPVSAIEVCQVAAPAIADAVSKGEAFTVRRTALRLRNAANAPDAWERATLERFLAAAAGGEDPAKLEHAEIVEEEGGQVFRWMKAIPTGAACAQCHGLEVAPEVTSAIEALYPDDAATGFAPGEMRGAFSVRKAL